MPRSSPPPHGSTRTGMNASRSSPLTSLYVAGPLSMGYVDFYTFLIPLYGLSLGFDASENGIPCHDLRCRTADGGDQSLIASRKPHAPVCLSAFLPSR